MPVPNERGPEQKSGARSTPPSVATNGTTHRRQDLATYWRRRPWLHCQCAQSCRCDYKDNPTPKRIDAYREAVEHLEHHNLNPAAFTPECRELWRRGGSDRELAEAVMGRWSTT